MSNGLLRDIDWETTGRIAVLMEAIKAAHHGTQSHSFPLTAFKKRFKDYFGYALIA
jgi:adenosine kinase